MHTEGTVNPLCMAWNSTHEFSGSDLASLGLVFAFLKIGLQSMPLWHAAVTESHPRAQEPQSVFSLLVDNHLESPQHLGVSGEAV